MPRTEPFETHPDRYDEWFEHNEATYRSELAALEQFVDGDADGLEIGVGSGQFADPLDIGVGVDPSREMLHRAAERGIRVIQGAAEALPLRSDRFDVALVVTTICFVDDVRATLAEAARVLDAAGRLVIGFVDRESEFGRHYREIAADNPFYSDATFLSATDVLAALEAEDYRDVAVAQTVFDPPGEHDAVDEPRAGHGEGSFVAIAARPPE
ncbi:MAG: class I SAM-dependent methyltransferase [Halanaeroarchaeum sp.]